MTMEKWEKVYDDVVTYDNSGNDFYYEWIDFEDNSLVDLFEEWLGVDVGSDSKKVKIKVNKGSIFITLAEKRKV